jgi:hypothetical protein
VRHGAYATLQLKPRAQEIAGWLAEQMGDAFDAKFSAAIEAAALAAARVERALAHLDDHDEETIEEKFSRLDDRARGWLRLYISTLERLGLTPEQGTPAVSVQVQTITVEHDAATQARIYSKLRAVGLVRGADVECEAHEVKEETTLPEDERSPVSSQNPISNPASAEGTS